MTRLVLLTPIPSGSAVEQTRESEPTPSYVADWLTEHPGPGSEVLANTKIAVLGGQRAYAAGPKEVRTVLGGVSERGWWLALRIGGDVGRAEGVEAAWAGLRGALRERGWALVEVG